MENKSNPNVKIEIRREIIARLNTMNPEEYEYYNQQIQQFFEELPQIKTARNLFIYYSVRHEVNTHRIIEKLLSDGKIVSLPVCIDGGNLLAKRILDINELVPAAYGLREPGEGAKEVNAVTIDVAIIPGVAFDKLGNRLGHGAGYYDRYLAKMKRGFKLGLAYDFQVVNYLPVEEWDVRLDGLLTPTQFFDFTHNINS